MSTNYLSVPYGRTVHGEEEIAAVVHVLRTSTQMGKHVREMEEKVAALFQKKSGIMFVNTKQHCVYVFLIGMYRKHLNSKPSDLEP